MEKIKYYDNKEEHGIIIDWAETFKRYHKIIKKAKVNDPIYDPTTAPVYNAKYFLIMSGSSETSAGRIASCASWALSRDL